MRVLIAPQSESFVLALHDAGIQYDVDTPKAGVGLFGLTQWLYIAGVAMPAIPVLQALSKVSVAWIGAKASRKISITKKDGTTIETTGFGVKQFKQAYELADEVEVIEEDGQ